MLKHMGHLETLLAALVPVHGLLVEEYFGATGCKSYRNCHWNCKKYGGQWKNYCVHHPSARL